MVIDDSDFAGTATFDLGGGIDLVRIDASDTDLWAVPLTRLTRFEGALTVYGRDGADTVMLGDDLTGTGVYVGGPIRLVGGVGIDDLQLRTAPPPNSYLSPSLFEDFETGDTF